MSMLGCSIETTDDQIRALQADPELIHSYLGLGDAPITPLSECCIDKAWHVIHFLLTGEPWEGEPPLNFIVIGGHEIGEDLGYGPARAFFAAEARTIAAALEPITRKDLRPRFNRAVMAENEIYPSIWHDDGDDDDLFDEFIVSYVELKNWLQGVVARGNGFVTYIG